MQRSGKRGDVRTGRLRAADPFELIRWLARSQTDPRKALAELVQNSLDAGARRVTITRIRERGLTALRIVDDGEGVIPDLPRPEALAHVATHIGHSRKRNLTPEQRRELMLQGQYGIGLLGFWAIGVELEMRSQIDAGEPWVLRMWEDRPSFEVAPLRGRFALEARTWTEVVIRRLHRPAFVTLTGRRIADYLAGELRGQLLARDVIVTVEDRIGRGTALKVRRVEPVRFTGVRLDVSDALAVDGFGTMRVEVYLVPEGSERQPLSVSCGGTVVYDELADAFDGRFRREPWIAGRLGGLLEFPDFSVAPGSRRGVLLDDAAEAFARVVERDLEPVVRAALAADERRRLEAVETDLVQKLERAFRDLSRAAPEYDLFAVRHAAMREAATVPDARAAAPDGLAAVTPVNETPTADDEPPELLPPGPLAKVEIRPARARVEALGRRILRARAVDAAGTRLRDGVVFVWRVENPALGRVEPGEMSEAPVVGMAADGGSVAADGGSVAVVCANRESAPVPVVHGETVVFAAGANTGQARVGVEGRAGDRVAAAAAEITIVDALPEPGVRAGIPEPAFIDDPGSEWRSRFTDGRWEVNGGHRDFVAAATAPRRKLRYLAALLAKEVVLHSFPVPQGGVLLERLVSVLALAEPRLERG
ncbi:MAG: ATP-binding protein [Deltaproteobacteria bacterium]|nr:ATP-binding protein [Deltaproteobacteria bacterium]